MACRPQRQVIQNLQRDSTVISDVLTEKVVHIAADSVTATLPIVIAPTSSAILLPPTAYKVVQARVTIEGKRAKVDLQITDKGEIKATAVCKELEEKVTVLERTISNYKSEVTEYQVKESRMKGALAEMRSWFKGILFSLVFIAVVAMAFKLGFNPISIIKKIISKS
jgi:hypothetical protein